MASLVGLGPLDNGFNGFCEVPAGLPSQFRPRLGTVELEVLRFMRVSTGVDLVAGAVAPKGAKLFDQPLNGFRIGVVGAKIPGFGKLGTFAVELFGQQQVAAQRLEDMLPGAQGCGIADQDFFPFQEGADTVRDQAIGAPITAADDIPRAGRSDGGRVKGEG